MTGIRRSSDGSDRRRDLELDGARRLLGVALDDQEVIDADATIVDQDGIELVRRRTVPPDDAGSVEG